MGPMVRMAHGATSGAVYTCMESDLNRVAVARNRLKVCKGAVTASKMSLDTPPPRSPLEQPKSVDKYKLHRRCLPAAYMGP